MSKIFTILILVCCGLLVLAGCAPAPDAAEEKPAVEEAAAEEEVIPTDTPIPPTEEPTVEEAEVEEETEAEEEPIAEMSLTSPAFNDGEEIPIQFSCDGENVSPDLDWFGIPEGTVSLTLFLDDPDSPGGTWDHWVVFNIPSDMPGLQQGITGVGVDGNNSWDRTGYDGPCPPGGTHRYVFKLYALDTTLDLPPGSYKGALEMAMEGHILAQVELMGTYSR